MSRPHNKYKVYLYKNDYNMMCAEVLRHKRIETGGNLFGLWTTSGDLVVHVALGPGEGCRRTETSFFQNIEYLSHVGRFLNEKYMLCHVGEWHSHHQLALDEPSDGDKRTVWSNFPEGAPKFLVIIGNLRLGPARDDVTVKLKPYFFIAEGRKCVEGTFQVLQVDSPMGRDPIIAAQVQSGSEGGHVSSTSSQSDPSISRGDNNRDRYSQGTVGNSAVQPSSTAQRQNSEQSSSHDMDMDIDQPALPPPDYGRQREPAVVSAQVPRFRPQGSSSGNRETTTPQQLTTPETRNLYAKIKSHFQNPEVDVENLPNGSTQMKFKHNSKIWEICLPQDFPTRPATVSKSYDSAYSRYKTLVSPSHPMKTESLNNYVNILLTIQRFCLLHCNCAHCQQFSFKTFVPQNTDADFDLFLTEEGNALVKSFCQKVEATIADAGSLKKEFVVDTKNRHSVEEPVVKISFEHEEKLWIVRVTSTFPKSPAKTSYIDQARGSSRYEVKFPSIPNGNFVSQTLSAIRQNCCCQKCKRAANW